MDTPWSLRRQYVAYAALSLTALGFTVLLLPAARADFQRFIGAANPLLVAFGCALVGGLALGWLHTRYGFQIVQGPRTPRGMAVASAIAAIGLFLLFESATKPSGIRSIRSPWLIHTVSWSDIPNP